MVPGDVLRDLAPAGTILAAINFGNGVLAQRDPQSGEARGVTAELATELGRRLGVPVDFVAHETAAAVSTSASSGRWTVGFLAVDPDRAAEIGFTPPYVIIEGTYVVRAESPFRSVGDVDRPGVRIAVSEKSGYDLHLTRTIKQAEIRRYSSPSAAREGFQKDHLEALAGVRQPLTKFAASDPGLRIMEDSFMQIRQAIAIPRGREAGLRYLTSFIEELKASGFVADALARTGQGDAQVAPPEQV